VLGLTWGQTIRHYLWPLVFLPIGFIGLIGDLVVLYGYNAQHPAINFWWDGLFLAFGLFGGWKLMRFQKVFRRVDLSSWSSLKSAADDLGWILLSEEGGRLIWQRTKRAHWRWSREKIVAFKMDDRVLIKSHRNPAITRGFFGSWQRNRDNESALVKAVGK
jgi:hypothetical protein